MPTLKIDGVEYEFEAGMSVIQVADMYGIEIPRFCYHEKLEIAGNCRMCLVEAKPGPPKPQASCALPAMDGQEISTKSEMVKKAREGVMEFLLINHPLDCPICDQGGECDLQDQAVFYGSGTSRYTEHKRAVEDKHMGPLIKTHMTRCIHCTRCVRFAEDIAGVPDLGAIYRGEETQITTYLEKTLASEMSANVIDLCPVGALTSKPYAFVSRPWELKKTETIDVMDAVGSNIRVDSRGEAVLRVMPRANDEVNEEWVSDKTRYACDGLKNQRLDRPYVRIDGKLKPASWAEAFDAIAAKVKGLEGDQMAALAGNLADVESMMALKELMAALGSERVDCRQDGAKIDASDRASYIMNTPLSQLSEADVVLFIGTNPREEAPIINARLRRAYIKNGAEFFNVGIPADLTYPVEELGNEPTILNKIFTGDHPVAKKLKDAKNPLVIIGSAATARQDGNSILSAAKAIAENCNVIRDDWNGFNMLHYAAARVGGLDIGFVPKKASDGVATFIEDIQQKQIEVLYLLGVDEIDMSYFGDSFIIYQGHHGDIGAHRADVILPGAAYTEKDAVYVNTEGRPQRAFPCVFPKGEAKEDWAIIRALSEHLECTLPYNSLTELRQHVATQAPVLAELDVVQKTAWKKASKQPKTFKITKEGFEPTIYNFYMTDPISRASETMAQCTKARAEMGHDQKEAA
ncbi:MAG: NADH-quinone oxidoreductase subunit NuoG [Rickettsiales bacterium]|nr:NADH-quinone oxidoreductase subunit NuoG [Rickettsiales bacterium]